MKVQTTIAKSVRCSGIGLHSGRRVDMELFPADANTGIVFKLNTEHGSKLLNPDPNQVVGTGLATTLGNKEGSVSTVEHLMASLRGMSIDNVLISVSGGEVPIMDGSAASFVYLLRTAGVRKLSAPRKVLAVTKAFEHRQGEKSIKAEPYNGFYVEYHIDFDHPLIGRQTVQFEVTPENFVSQVSKARTFGFLQEVEMLHKNGLALGGALDNAIVLDEYGVVNAEGLRCDDEFVRHKALDFIGDMAVAPYPLQGKFTVRCSGHAFNNEFLRLITDEASSYLQLREATPVSGLQNEPASQKVGAEGLSPVLA